MRRFTLLEVIVAMVILGVGLAMASTAISMSRLRGAGAARLLFEEHLLVQAAEYYLLNPRADALPEEVFPYSDYTINVRVADAVMSDGRPNMLNGMRLEQLTLELVDATGEVRRELSLERIVIIGGGQ